MRDDRVSVTIFDDDVAVILPELVRALHPRLTPAVAGEAAERHTLDYLMRQGLKLVAANYRSRFGEFHLGETSNYILNHATCRVWLVRDSYDTAMESAA